MSRLNPEGVRFVHQRSRPLEVYSMEQAGEIIDKAIADAKGKPSIGEGIGRHIAWLIGFDTLIDDRTEIQRITSLVVEDGEA